MSVTSRAGRPAKARRALSATAAAIAAITIGSHAHAQEAGPSSSAGAVSPQDPPPICTDRPSKADSPCSVPAGYWQVESDLLNVSHDPENGVTTDTLLLSNPTLKYGLTQTIDVEVNIAPAEVVRVSAAGHPTQTMTGIGDLYLRLKDNSYNSSDSSLSIGLIPYVKLPTARIGIGDGAIEAGLVSVIKYQISKSTSLSMGPEVDALRNADSFGRHANFANLLNLSTSLAHNLSISEEVWADWNLDPSGTVRQSSFDESLAWSYNNRSQLDIGINLGLNRTTPAVQLYIGLSKEFP